MGLLIPISAERVALAFNQWCTIHASLDGPWDVAEAQSDRRVAVRTVCGSDVFPYIPPPPDLRCRDCERILGRPRKTRGGWGTWDTLREAAS